MDMIQFKLVMVMFQVRSLTQPELGHLQKSNIQPLKYLKFRVLIKTSLKLVRF
jgi:hypothetical protein